MNKLNSTYQKAVRIQIFVCGLLFSIFSFVYIFVFQRDVLEALHFSLAHGKTHFSPIGSALVMTLTLILLTWGVNLVASFKGKYRSLVYMPAFFVLMAISDIGRDVYTHDGNSMWLWVLPTLIGGFIGIALWCRKAFGVSTDTEISSNTLLGTNIFFLLAGCIATLNIGNTDATFHHELEIERNLRDKNYIEAMKVGKHSLDASQTLTALRALAVSNAGLMGEKLFTYPQYFGAKGLFFPEDSLQTLRYTNDSVYTHLGARPYNGGNKLIYLSSLCYDERGKFTALDYYLSALLLDKKVGSFAEVIEDFYEPGDTLPRHYQEAIMIYKRSNPKYLYVPTHSTIIQKYASYEHRKTEFQSKNQEKNQMRREYGDTYWWYHDYQE